MKSRPLINCQREDWIKALHSCLYKGIEVDLLNFDCAKHGEDCDLIAEAFAMEFRLNRDLQSRAAHFRRKARPFPPRSSSSQFRLGSLD